MSCWYDAYAACDAVCTSAILGLDSAMPEHTPTNGSSLRDLSPRFARHIQAASWVRFKT